MYVGIPNSKRKKCRTFKGIKDENEAIKLAIAFKDELKANNYDTKNLVIEEKPDNLGNGIACYIDWLNDIGVPEQFHKGIDEDSIKEEIYYLKHIPKQLLSIPIGEFNDNHAGIVFHMLITKPGKKTPVIKPKTHNKFVTEYRRLFKFFTDNDLTKSNPFNKFKMKKVVSEPDMLYPEEILGIIHQIQTGERKKEVKNKRKGKIVTCKRNMYRTWLVDAVWLGVYTGLRTESVVELKWNQIRKDIHGEYFLVPNLKVERIQKEGYPPIKVEITEEFLKYLKAIGYNEYRGTNRYILGADSGYKRETMIEDISKCFSFFCQQIGITEKTYKHLRKTNITYKDDILGNETYKSTGHESMKMLNSNYIARDLRRKKVRGLTIFEGEISLDYNQGRKLEDKNPEK